MKIHKFIFPALLALVLLLSQQIGYAHAVSHLSDGSRHSQQNKQLPAEPACDECLASAQIGSALSNHAQLILADTAPNPVTLALDTQVLVSRTVCVFLSRAPPVAA